MILQRMFEAEVRGMSIGKLLGELILAITNGELFRQMLAK
jgi:hypothetical protein